MVALAKGPISIEDLVPTKPSQAPSPASSFKAENSQKAQQELQQKAQQRVPQLPPTRVGAVEEKVGGVISSALNIPFLGPFVINPAIAVSSAIDDYVFEPILEEVAALSPALYRDVAKKNPNNSVFANLRLAREYANEVNVGQALAEPIIGGMLGPFANNKFVLDHLPFLREDFDLTDTEAREDYFKNDPVGIAISGTLAFGAMAATSKGTGAASTALRGAALGNRTIKNSGDLAQFRTRVDNAVESINNGDTANGIYGDAMTKLLDDAVKEKDVTSLLNNSLVAASNNPMRAATILSHVDNANDVGDYLKAERGDLAALERLFNSQTSAADALTGHGFKQTPLSDFAMVHEIPDAAMASRLVKIVGEVGKRDEALANALDSFAAEKASGIAVSSYQPGRYAGLEKLTTSRARAKARLQYGDTEIFGKAEDGSWKSSFYKSSAYDRGIRMITWAGTGRPQGYVNISNPRRYEVQYDILSDLNRVNFLKGQKGAEFKREIIRNFSAEITDTGRALSIADLEKRVMLQMAKEYNVGNLKGIDGNLEDAIKQIDEWHASISSRRQSARDFVDNHDLMPDEDGNINMIDLKMRANEPTTIPLLDFRKLELEVIRQMRRKTKKGDVEGEGVDAGTAARGAAARFTMGLNTYFDIANMLFSNMNLLRLAYIPKNSIIDPAARASMDQQTIFGLRNVVPGIGNILYNRSQAALYGGKLLATAYSRRQLNKDFSAAASDLKAQMRISIDGAKELKQMDLDLKRLNRRIATNNNKLKAEKDPAKKLQISTQIAEAKARIDSINTRAVGRRAEVDDAKTKIPALEMHAAEMRKQVTDIETDLATIRSKRRTIGQKEFVLDVDGQKFTLPGLADPNIKGVKSWFRGISAMEDFYAATRRSELSNNISAAQQKWVKIGINNWDAYTNAITHTANRFVRNELEEIGGMVIRGESVDSMMNWLYKTPDGREYLRRMADRIEDKTQAGVRDWLEGTQKDLLAMFPDEQLRRIILERDVSTGEISAFLKDRPGMPQYVKGPDITGALALQEAKNASGKFGGTAAAVSKVGVVTDVGWKILSGVENRLVRNPLFMTYARQSMVEQVRAAKLAGIDVSDAVVHNQIRQQAYRAATERIEQTLYSARRLTNAGYVMRYLMSFPAAYYNSQVTALRLMAKNPANAMWYQSVVDSADGFAPYEDEDGNVYQEIDDVPKGKSVSLAFPMFDVLGKTPLVGGQLQDAYKQSMGIYAPNDAIGGQTKMNPKQLEFMLGDPSISFLTNIALSEAIKRGVSVGPWKIYGEDIDAAMRATVGDDVYESSVLFQGRPVSGTNIFETTLNAAVPSYMSSLAGGVASLFGRRESWIDDTFGRDVGAMSKYALREYYKNGAMGRAPDQDDVIQATGVMSFIKAAVQFSAMLSVTFDPETRAAQNLYQDLVEENNGDYKAAEDRFVELYGVENLVLLGSGTKNNAGLAITRQDLRTYRKHSDLMYNMYSIAGNNPAAASMLSFGYGDEGDEYDDVVSEIFKNSRFPGIDMPLTERKRVEEIMNDSIRRIGWYEHNKLIQFRDSIMEQSNIKSTRDNRYRTSGLKQFVENEEKRLGDKYRSWYVEKEKARSAFWVETFEPLKAATDDAKWMADAAQAGPLWSEIADWVTQAEDFHNKYENERNDPTGGKPRLGPMSESFAAWHFDYINNASPRFQTFAARWLDSLPELKDTDAMEAQPNG